MVNVASISRRPAAEHVAPNRPPGSSRGPATPTVTGRVTKSSPSFFGYPWWYPRTMAKSRSTQMYAHRLYVSPRYEQRTTTNVSRYWERTGSSSSSNESLQLCQSAQITATAPGSSSAGCSGGGSSSATAAGSVRSSIVSIVPL